MVCDKHLKNPVKGYSPCVGCEIEYYQNKLTLNEKYIKELELEIEELKDEIHRFSKYIDNF